MSTRDKTKRDTAVLGMDPLLSMQVGEFVLQERIGAGGMGVVYRATHPLIGKQVAIKVLRPELMSEQQVERLLIEARSVNAIQHPGIIDIFGFGSLPDGRPYIIMELLQGHTLGQLIQQQGRLDAGTTLWILDQMLSALGAAHRASIIHRDLKPGNVFLAEAADGKRSVKLVDFGIAKLLESRDSPTTADGTILGTPEYMAPEQVRGKPVGPATDLYAVGIIAFQMLTGARPFQGEPLQVLFAHVEQQPPLPSSKVPGVPPELDTLVLHLLAKDPALRPESAEAIRRALSRISEALPSQPAANAPEPVTLAAPISELFPSAPSTVSTTTLGKPTVQGRGQRLAMATVLVAGLGAGVMLLPALLMTGEPSAPVTEEVAKSPPTVPPAEAPTAPANVAEAAPPSVPAEQPAAEERPPAAQEPVLAEARPAQPEAPSVVDSEPPPQVELPTRSVASKSRSKSGASQKPESALEEEPLAVAPEVQAEPPVAESALEEEPLAVAPKVQAEPPVDVVTPPPPQRREAFLMHSGFVTSDARLTRRFAQLEKLYLDQTTGRASLPEFEQELEHLHRRAQKAETASERMDVQRALDVWREHLDQTLRGNMVAAKQPLAATTQPSALFTTGKAVKRSLELRQSLLAELKQAEQELRARVGDVVDGSPALDNLEKLRTRAQSTTTSEERTTLRSELATWKRLHLGQASGTAP